MRTSGARHFPLFDAVRGLAVLSVVLFHVASLTGQLGIGAAGRLMQVLGGQSVIVFFVLSGFLLYRPYVLARAGERPDVPAGRFLRRRALRILPAYWVALTLLAIHPGIIGPFSSDWWIYYGLLQLYDTETFGLGIPPAWTLCVEATFYLALPLWAALVRRWTAPGWVRAELLALAALAAVGIAVQLLRSRQLLGPVWADALPGQAAWFALGMAVAVASVARAEHRPGFFAQVARRPGACWLAAAAALAGLAALVPEGGLLGLVFALDRPQPVAETVARLVLSAIVAFGVMAPAVFDAPEGRRSFPGRVLAVAPVAFLGTISYSLYLYHLTIAELLALPEDPGHFTAGGLDLLGAVDRAQTPVLLVATLAVTVPPAWISRRWIEVPFLRTGRGRPGRPRT